MLRTLVILLLMLRVVASPLAMRPDSHRTPTIYRLVARVCAWPVQGPLRSLSATSLVPRFPGNRPGNFEYWDHGSGPKNILSLTQRGLIPPWQPRLAGLVVESARRPLAVLASHLHRQLS